MFTKIVTHPGGAHKDDFLACAILLTQSPVSIERREPSEADLADPAVAVVDIGHAHAPEQGNFDHHQFPRDSTPTCALSLVLQRFGLYADAREFCEWMEVTEWFDCRGPTETGTRLGIDRDTLAALNSPIDITLLRRFASQPVHSPSEPVWAVMEMIGQDLVAYLRTTRARLDFIAANAQIWKLATGESEHQVLYLRRMEPLPEDASAGLGLHVRKLGLEEEIAAVVYPDGRGEGYGMRRFNDNPSMEFTRIDSEPDVHFTHARGFIAKTSATEPARLRELLKLAAGG